MASEGQGGGCHIPRAYVIMAENGWLGGNAVDIAIYTLGCKVNQVETQAMERELIRRLRDAVAELRYLGLKDSEIIALMDESGVGQ